ncbi:hypothetical protein [Butyribacter sp.]|uniref:hypothetical protein n=1 Tax=Butyribacter sp. TaxID=2822465 RepID=UPI002A9F3335|nr:hypothetical protein [Butyribacter sp.]
MIKDNKIKLLYGANMRRMWKYSSLFICENKITKKESELYDEDLRERLLSREQIQKLDLVTQTILFTMQSIMTKKLVVGFMFGWILIPVAVLKLLFFRR